MEFQLPIATFECYTVINKRLQTARLPDWRAMLLPILCFCMPVLAQPVRAPHAQALIYELMTRHQEMQTIGLHVTPPGWTDNLNIACSKPGKVGKLSADVDIAVIESGKPSMRRTEKGAYDMGLPLADAAGRALGMVVIVIRETFTKDPDAALKQAFAIRNELHDRIPGLASLLKGATLVQSPAALIAQTPLPHVTGDFAHFAAAPARNRVYLAAEDNHSIEVFDLKGEHVQSALIVIEPHVLAYDTERNILLVADGGNDSCTVLDATDLHLVERIPLPSGVNSGIFDPASRRFFIGVDGAVTVVSARQLTLTSRIALPSLDVQAMAYDRASDRLYVNLRDKGQIAVVSVPKGKLEALWNLPSLTQNTAIALDTRAGRLFVAGRSPAKLAVIDTQSGKALQTLDAAEGAADLWFDSERSRLYLTGTGGLSTYLSQSGRYQLDSQFGTMQSRTSIYLPELRQLYAAHGKNREDGAALQVYKIR